MRVLVVEDQAPVRALISKMLRGLGYHVLEALNTRSSITYLARVHNKAEA